MTGHLTTAAQRKFHCQKDVRHSAQQEQPEEERSSSSLSPPRCYSRVTGSSFSRHQFAKRLPRTMACPPCTGRRQHVPHRAGRIPEGVGKSCPPLLTPSALRYCRARNLSRQYSRILLPQFVDMIDANNACRVAVHSIAVTALNVRS